MATKFLDNSGLSYFWTKIKSYVAGLLALKADDSNVVHKTGNESISGTKTFNSRIVGTIGKSVGDGTFADMIQTYQSDNNSYRSCTIRCTNGDGYNSILIGAHNESNNAPNGLVIQNTDGAITGDFYGSLRLVKEADIDGTQYNDPPLLIGSSSSVHLEFDADEIMAKSSGTTTGALFLNADGGDVYIGGNTNNYKSVTGRGKGSSTVPVYTDADGIVTACGSSLDVGITGNAATATKLETARTINGVSFDGSSNITVADSTKVAKAGDTMTGNLTISKASPRFETKNTAITRGTSPSSDTNVTEFLGKDSADKSTWALYHRYATNKSHRISLLCYNGLTTDTTYSEIGIGYDSSGNPYTNAPTPSSASDNSTNIATTAWVRTATGNFACNAATATKLAAAITINGVSFDGSANITVEDSTKVSKTGNEDISGVKTFTGMIELKSVNDASYREFAFNAADGTAIGRIRFNGPDHATPMLQIGYRGTSGANWYNGSNLQLQASGAFELYANDGSASKKLAGDKTGTLTWDGQAIQTSSDERLKTLLEPVPDAVLNAWEDVSWGQFQYLDAVASKGESARLHIGLIAQHVMSVFRKHGLDACVYGILCHEEREAAEDSEAVDLWMVRYAEAQAMEAACMRRENARLKARLAALEERLAALEVK